MMGSEVQNNLDNNLSIVQLDIGRDIYFGFARPHPNTGS